MTTDDTRNEIPAALGLDAVDPATTDLVGGKAANLAAMLAAGYPVPAGFCVPTSAYREAVSIGEVLDEIEQTPPTDTERLVGLAARAREMTLGTAVPPHIADAISDAYRRFTTEQSPAVAVRSSSTSEDLPDASFAGQYDTYLNVRGTDEVLNALRRCWASLWSDRAVLYRAANGIDQHRAEIAVVVQRMVDADKAGVLFTANPVTGCRTEMVVESTDGLGEAVVSGTVRPDHHVIGPDDEVTGSGTLSQAQLTELRTVGRSLLEHFGAPQDAEWAIDGDGELWLTQSRPITTLFPVPETTSGPPRVYWSLNAYQGLSQPFTPIGAYMIRLRQTSFHPNVSYLGIAEEIPDVAGWLYWEVTDGARSASRRKQLGGLIDAFTAPAGEAVRRLADDPRFTPDADPLEGKGPLAKKKHRLRTAFTLLWPSAARASILARADAMVRGCAGPDRATPEQRLDFVERTAPKIARIELDLPRESTVGYDAARIGTKLLTGHADAGEINAVFRGVPNNPTTDMDLALWRLSVEIRGDAAAAGLLLATGPGELAAKHLAGVLPELVQQGVAKFLRTYGCRVSSEIDLGVPRWSDDPEPVFAMLANYLRTTDRAQDAEHRFTEAAAAAEAKIDELVGRLPAWRLPQALVAKSMLRRSRALRGLRELNKFCLMRGFAEIREQLMHIGRELAQRGLLARPDDAMFLEPQELRKALQGNDFRPTVAERRANYEQESKRPRIPSVVLSDGTVLEADAPQDSSEERLSGLAAATGVVTGVARVVHDPNNAHLEPGEILVAPSTDPGWTPLFLTASALVSETGGLTSHGTTVAREYGIPAVVGVSNATQRIRSGDRITVDGSAGKVTING